MCLRQKLLMQACMLESAACTAGNMAFVNFASKTMLRIPVLFAGWRVLPHDPAQEPGATRWGCGWGRSRADKHRSQRLQLQVRALCMHSCSSLWLVWLQK